MTDFFSVKVNNNKNVLFRVRVSEIVTLSLLVLPKEKLSVAYV
jgi:hypothetical protein